MPAEPSGSNDAPGLFDFPARIAEGIDNWFRDLVTDAAQPVLDLLGVLLFATPEVTAEGHVRDVWLVSWGTANTVFVLFIVGAGALGMAHETMQSRYAVKELLPRLIFAFVAANASLGIAGLAIELANALSGAFIAQGLGFEGFAALFKMLFSAVAIGSSPILSVIVGLFVLVLALALAGTSIARMATVVVLVAAGPLFLIGHALPVTQGAARLWWRALVGCLAVQVAQAFLFMTAVRVFFSAPSGGLLRLPASGFADLILMACLLWLLLRIPTYARRVVFSSPSNAAISVVAQQVRRQVVRVAAMAAA